MRAIIFLITFISIIGIANGEVAAGGVEVKCEEMSPKKFIEMVEKKDKKLAIVDYRMPEDYYIKGHIPGAILLSPNDKDLLQQRLDYLALQWKRNGRTAVIVDNDGTEANIFCRNMKLSTRYEHIYSLKGGMNLWKLPLETGKMPSPEAKKGVKDKIVKGGK